MNGKENFRVINGANYEKAYEVMHNEHRRQYLRSKLVCATRDKVQDAIRKCNQNPKDFHLYLSTIPGFAEHDTAGPEHMEYCIYASCNHETETAHLLFYSCNEEDTDQWIMADINEGGFTYQDSLSDNLKEDCSLEVLDCVYEYMKDCLRSFAWVKVIREMEAKLHMIYHRDLTAEEVFVEYRRYQVLLDVYRDLRKDAFLAMIYCVDEDGVAGNRLGLVSKAKNQRHLGLTFHNNEMELCFISLDEWNKRYIRVGEMIAFKNQYLTASFFKFLTSGKNSAEESYEFKEDIRYLWQISQEEEMERRSAA